MQVLTILGLGLGLGLLGAVAATAAPCDHEGRREAMRAAAGESFAQADADGDGALTPDEFATFHDLMRTRFQEKRFTKADANGDGLVTLEELTESHGKRHKRGAF